MGASLEKRSTSDGRLEDTDIIVTFIGEGVFSSENSDGSEPSQLVVPRGTQLIGIWEDEQPEDGEACAVRINGETWSILYEDATVACPVDRRVPWGEQERIATEHREQAQAAFKRQDGEEARRLYACCLIEFEAIRAHQLRMADVYVEYAAALMQTEARREAIVTLEKAASTFSSAGEEPLLRMTGEHVEYAEQAAQVLMTLLRLYLHNEDQALIRRTIERLLVVNKQVKKRYTTKVDLLLWVVEGYLVLGESEQAVTYFEQAKRFYSQQLARYSGMPYLDPKEITEHLHRLEPAVRKKTASRTIKCTLIAETADDLEAALGTLRERVPDLVVTRSGLQATKSPRMAERYTATLRITIRQERS